jgi:hypothetical protein
LGGLIGGFVRRFSISDLICHGVYVREFIINFFDLNRVIFVSGNNNAGACFERGSILEVNFGDIHEIFLLPLSGFFEMNLIFEIFFCFFGENFNFL